MKKITKDELNEILKQHKLYRDTAGKEGKRADLSNADLTGVDLSNTDLTGANLRYADLSMADLHDANFSGADMYKVALSGANMHGAILIETCICYSDFSDAGLIGKVDISKAYILSLK